MGLQGGGVSAETYTFVKVKGDDCQLNGCLT